jgi:hypothetical protein
MDKSSTWRSGLLINLVSNFIAFVVGAIVTYFTHEGSGWVRPVLFGGAAWLMTFGSILAWRIMKHYPPRIEVVTPDNIQHIVRQWVDKFSLTVQSIRDPGSQFYFIVTTDGGKRFRLAEAKNLPSMTTCF